MAKRTLREKFDNPEIKFCGWAHFHREHHWDNTSEFMEMSDDIEFYICKGWAVAPPARK